MLRGKMANIFPDRTAYNNKVVEIGIGYAKAGVSRETAPEQVCNFLEFTGEARDPSISFCAAFGGYIRAHAYCDLMHVPYTEDNVVNVFRGIAPIIEIHDVLTSASCEEVRQYGILHGIYHTVSSMGDATKFKPGWIMLMNYETKNPKAKEAHHYATVVKGISSRTVQTVEGNTSSISQADGGACAMKTRSLDDIHYRGVIITY